MQYCLQLFYLCVVVNKKTIKHLYTTFFFTLLVAYAWPQNKGELIEQTLDVFTPFTVIQYSTKNGLPQNQVIDIISDEKGELILSTANGIVRFNGEEFKTFITGIEYKSNRYKKLFWHSKTGILSGLESDGSFRCIYPFYYQIQGTIVNNERVCNGIIHNDSLWLITSVGNLYNYTYGKRSLEKVVNVPVKWSNSMAYNAPHLYVTNDSILFRLNILSKKQEVISNTIEFHRLEKNPFNNCLYGITNEKLYRIEPTLNEIFNINSKGPTETCSDIAFPDSESVFLATTKGLFLVEPEFPEHYTKEDGLPSNYCGSVFYNQAENCLFVGTGEKGLLKLQLKNAYTFHKQHGLGDASLSSIIQTKNKEVLVTENCCHITQLLPDTSIPYSNVTANYSCIAEVDDIIYAGTWGKGVYLLKDQQLYKHVTEPEINNGFVHSVFKDSKNNIWIGTSNGIAVGKRHKNFTPILQTQVKGLIITIYELKNGAVCFGGTEGVYIVNSGKLVQKIGRNMGLQGKEVRAIYEDDEGKLWIGVYDGGVYCFNNNKLTSINKMNGCMLDNDAFCLAPDEFGYFYITSNHGLWRVAYKDLNDFYYGKTKYLIPFQYDQENGILNPEFNGGFQNNYLKTNMSHFYFPTIEGVVMVDPEEPIFRKLHPSINNVIVNDTLLANNKHVFERNTYSIQFDFSCINYLNKYNVYYQHKLEGEKQTDWSIPQKSNTVHLKMLPPGKYKFMVRAIDGFNDRTPNIAIFEFEIEPYFYETTIFKILLLFFIVSIVTIIAITRFNYLRRTSEKKEIIQRQLAEFELKAIQSQMSLHFIFNCLNSIKYFVVSGQNESAEKFLDHFSLLIRKFLENSDVIEVTVTEEAAMLNEYLALEKMRMSNKMNFTVYVDPSCKSIIIPTMLTQPYVENAIKHGIAHLKRAGNINVKFKMNAGSLVCTIDDDGIGRKKGMEISLQTRKHIPKGMGLVQEKSKILKELHNKDILIAIVDKVNGQGEATGTQVIISIPT